MNPRGGCHGEGRHQFPSLSRIDLPRLDAPPNPLFSYLNLNNQSPITNPQPTSYLSFDLIPSESPLPPLFRLAHKQTHQVFPSPPSRTLLAKHRQQKESKSCQEGEKTKTYHSPTPLRFKNGPCNIVKCFNNVVIVGVVVFILVFSFVIF